jgi:hypothetical protein
VLAPETVLTESVTEALLKPMRFVAVAGAAGVVYMLAVITVRGELSVPVQEL